MALLADWEARYAAAAAHLMRIEDVLAVRAALATTWPEDRLAARWLEKPPEFGAGARVGVLAGSFNPLTPAHTALMRAASRSLRLSAEIWTLSQVSVDKEQVARATLVDRTLQMQAFLRMRAGAAGLLVLAAGLYADQARALRALLPADARLWLIMGYDKLVQIFDSRYYPDRDAALRRLFAAADLAVAPRGAHRAADLRDLLALGENRPFARQVRLLPARPDLADYSSTVARERAAKDGTAAALAGHMEPEGAALALTTWAYATPMVLATGEAIDPYALRQALIHRFAGRPHLPRTNALAPLFERVCAPTVAGERLRKTLRHDRPQR